MAADRLTLVADAAVGPAAAAAFARLVEERARRRPVAQILGRRAFWGREFKVTRRRARPAPGDRDADRPGARRGRRRRACSTSAPAAARSSHAARRMAGGARASAPMSAARRWRSPPATPRASGWARAPPLPSRTGPTASPSASRSSSATRPTSRRASSPRWRARCATGSRRCALSPGPTGLESYRRIAGGLASAAGAGRAGAPRDRRRPGRGGGRALRRRRLRPRRAASRPRRAPAGGRGRAA